MLQSRFAFVLSAALLLLVSGCAAGGKGGPKTVAASGKVTYKNLPVEGATVSFLGDGKTPPAIAITDSSGEFVLTTVRSGDGAVTGTHRVTVTKIVGPAKKAAKTNMTMEEAAKAAQEPAEAKPLSMLPDKYASVDSSDLQFEVKSSGSNIFEIKLTD